MEETKLESSYVCTSCKLSKSSDAFSKKQFKRLEKDKDFEIKCTDCLSTQQELHKQQVKQEKKEKQKQKLVDPSQLYHLHPLNAPVMKDFQRFFFNQYGIEPEISLGKKTKWRTSVKLAVRGEIGADKKLDTQIGLFGPGSHSVIDCTNSPAHHTRINEAVKLIKQTIDTLEIGGYIEGLNAEDKKINKYKAYLRYLLLSVERKSGLVQLSIIWNATKTTTNATTLLNSLIDQLTESTLVKNNDQFSYKKSRLFHSIWVNYFPVTDIHNNSITERDREQWELKFGKEYVEESIATDFHYAVAKNKKVVKPLLYFPPFVFRQANIDKFEEIIQFIRRSIQNFQTEAKASQSTLESAIFNCLELYGGVGTIGLNCLDLFDIFTTMHEECPKITNLVIEVTKAHSNDLTKIESIVMKPTPSITNFTLRGHVLPPNGFNAFVSMKRLELLDWYEDSASMKIFQTIPQTLLELEINVTDKILSGLISSIGHNIPNLQSLVVRVNGTEKIRRELDINAMTSLTKTCSNLMNFQLIGCLHLSVEAFSRIIELKLLKKLALPLNEEILLVLPTFLSQTEYLEEIILQSIESDASKWESIEERLLSISELNPAVRITLQEDNGSF